ncbi:MAG: hypothetical protein ABF240_11295, partial [Flavobacteriales bacterium]
AEATQPEYLVATVVDDSTERPSELVEEKEESNQEVNAEYDNENSENTGMNSVPDSAEAPQKEVSEVTRSRVKKLQFAAQFGLIAYDDFDLSSPSFDVKTGMFFGLEAEYLLSSSFSVSVGANVYNRQSDNLIIAFDEQDKGFGKIRNRKTYSYTNLYFLEAPITLNYNINAKHKIGAGPTFTRLLTTKVEVNEEFPAASSANESEYMYHYNTFNLNNVGINLNYQYLFGRVGINVGYTQGINEFLNKETFKSSGFSNLSRVNFAIKYRL